MEEEVDSEEIILAATRLYPGDPAWVYGFDKNFFAEGRWTKLESVGSVTSNDSSITDQLFDALNNKEADFSGYQEARLLQVEILLALWLSKIQKVKEPLL